MAAVLFEGLLGCRDLAVCGGCFRGELPFIGLVGGEIVDRIPLRSEATEVVLGAWLNFVANGFEEPLVRMAVSDSSSLLSPSELLSLELDGEYSVIGRRLTFVGIARDVLPASCCATALGTFPTETLRDPGGRISLGSTVSPKATEGGGGRRIPEGMLSVLTLAAKGFAAGCGRLALTGLFFSESSSDDEAQPFRSLVFV